MQPKLIKYLKKNPTKTNKTQKTRSRIKTPKTFYTANSTVQAVEKQYNYMQGLVETCLIHDEHADQIHSPPTSLSQKYLKGRGQL